MEYLELAKKLISVPSTSEGTDNLVKVIDVANDYFANTRVYLTNLVHNKKPSLVITLKKTKSPQIFLNGHLDVIPGETFQFKPYVKDGKLIGRGAQDMKAACAVMMFLVKKLSKLKSQPSVGLMLVTDEEVGGLDGSGYLAKRGYLPQKILIAGESTNLNVEYGTKGVLWLELTSIGKSAHGAYPWRGENAAVKLLDCITRIYKKYPPLTSEQWKTSVNLSRIVAGDAVNRIPDVAKCVLDIRYIPEDRPESVVRNIKKLLGGRARVKVLVNEPPVKNNPNDKYIKELKSTVKSITGKKVELIKLHGSADTRFFSSLGIPAVSLGPKGGGQHGKFEYVDLESLGLLASTLETFILKNGY